MNFRSISCFSQYPGYPTIYGDNINTTTGTVHRIEIVLNKEVAVA